MILPLSLQRSMVGNYRILSQVSTKRLMNLTLQLELNRQGALTPFYSQENSHWHTANLYSLGLMLFQLSPAMAQKGKPSQSGSP